MPCRTLCFDTSMRNFSVALLESEGPIFQTVPSSEPGERSNSKSLTKSIKDLIDEAGWMLKDIERVAFTIGPGSFSGLRMGAVTAKVLSYSLGIPIFGLNTLEVIAFRAAIAGAAHVGSEVVALLDAQRGELFAQRFKISPEGLPEALEQRRVVSSSELECLYPEGILTGSGLTIITRTARHPPSDELATRRLAALAPRLTPEPIWPSDAASAGKLAQRLGSRLQAIDQWSLVPDYGRPSAAEEKVIERELQLPRQ